MQLWQRATKNAENQNCKQIIDILREEIRELEHELQNGTSINAAREAADVVMVLAGICEKIGYDFDAHCQMCLDKNMEKIFFVHDEALAAQAAWEVEWVSAKIEKIQIDQDQGYILRVANDCRSASGRWFTANKLLKKSP
jgi:hypothetical protein